MSANFDPATVQSFGDEWTRHPQSGVPTQELETIFWDYFRIFPWHELPADAHGFDMGSGSGRWADFVAPRVGHLHLIDAAEEALAVARKNLKHHTNLCFHHATTDALPHLAGSFDFGYSLGVLHHIPDTRAALGDCVALLRPGAPFLLYLYYKFDDRPAWFRAVWRLSDLARRVIYRLPPSLKSAACDVLALAVYLPLSRLARLVEKLGGEPATMPLSYYRHQSFATLRTDSRDRFGTPLEQRFSRTEIDAMMKSVGLERISFSEAAPFWCAVGFKRQD